MVSMVPSSLDIVLSTCSLLNWSQPAVVPPGVHSGSASTNLLKPAPVPIYISSTKMTN